MVNSKFACTLIILSIAFFVTPQTICAKDTTLILKHRTLVSTLAAKYYNSVYYEPLIKRLNYLTTDNIEPDDTVIIPDLDTLFIKSKFSNVFNDEIKLIEKAITFQTSMYTYKADTQKIGIDSLSKNGKKGAALINEAVQSIKVKCDSLQLSVPSKVISQLNSAAQDMSQYSNYLHSSSDIYASKNIYTGNLHMRLWRMYAILWSMQ